MHHIAATKTITKSTASVANSATFTAEIDTLAYEYASIDVVLSPFTAAAATAALVLRVGESDTASQGTNATSITGFVGGTSFTVAAGSTTGADNGYVARFNIDLRGRKRYLTVVATPALTVGVAAVARLGRGNQAPIDATSGNVNNWVSG